MTDRVGTVIVPGKARDEEDAFCLFKSRNAAWHDHSSNPKGRRPAKRNPSLFVAHLDHQTSLLTPSLALCGAAARPSFSEGIPLAFWNNQPAAIN
jgi:hypothetical protein